jgi:hypothetical protein
LRNRSAWPLPPAPGPTMAAPVSLLKDSSGYLRSSAPLSKSNLNTTPLSADKLAAAHEASIHSIVVSVFIV